MARHKHAVVYLVLVCFMTMLFQIDDAEGRRKRRRRKKPKTPIATHGEVTILSATVGAKIFINDKLIGLVPYNKPIKLKPGSYTVKVTKRGYTDYLDVFKIVAGKTTDLEIDLIGFQGILKISCTPPDAEIYLGKKYLGAPPIDKDVTVGTHVVMVKKQGFYDYVKEISVQAGKEIKLQVLLKAIPGWKPPEVVIKQKTKTPFYKTWWFWTIIGVAVAGGATAGIVLGTRGSTTSAPSPNFSITPP
ncbi:MAG: PEGA domain-containing protein [Myxococcales bacterium]|nr:PEGA domain-containing protein [Myxococcales bacterium]